MKRYRLIKEYPNSPKLNTIIYKNLLNGDWIYDGIRVVLLSKDNPEDYPEYWQEIVEKEYEILAFKYNSNSAYPGSIWDVDHRGLFGAVGNIHWCSLKSMIDNINNGNSNRDIYSVKRLSDGKVFTIGDNTNYGIIESIHHQYLDYKDKSRKNINIITLGCSKIDGDADLDEIQKAKIPLFTTEDGVDIFEGDKVKVVFTKLYNSMIVEMNSKNYLTYYREGTKVFGNTANAEEYILMNKPCLSLIDIKNQGYDYHTIRGLKKLAKSKL